jgi:hypothetical protein
MSLHVFSTSFRVVLLRLILVASILLLVSLRFICVNHRFFISLTVCSLHCMFCHGHMSFRVCSCLKSLIIRYDKMVSHRSFRA